MSKRSRARWFGATLLTLALVVSGANAVSFSVPVAIEIWLSTPTAVQSGLPSRISNWNGVSRVHIENALPDAERSFGTGLQDHVLRIWVVTLPDGLTKVYFAFREGGTTRYLERQLELGTAWGEVELEQLAEVVRSSGEALAEGIVGTHVLDELSLTEKPGGAPATASEPTFVPTRREERESQRAVVDSRALGASPAKSPGGSRAMLLPFATLGTRFHNGMLAGWTAGLEVGIGVRRSTPWGNCDLGAGAGMELPHEKRTDSSVLTVAQSDLRLSLMCGPQLGKWGLLGGVAVAATRRSLLVSEWYGSLPAVVRSEQAWRGAGLAGARLYYRSGHVELGLAAWLQRNDREIVYVSDDGKATEVISSTGFWETFASLDARLWL